MSDNDRLLPGAPALRGLGLIGDPFDPPSGRDAAGIREITHAAALGLLAKLDAVAADPRSTPVWVTKADSIPTYYPLSALAEILGSLSSSADMRVLGAFVPLDMMSIGRIRSALSAVAEQLSGPSFDRVLAAWTLASLAELDGSLPEAALLDGEAVSRLRERLEAEPVETLARYFGPYEAERDKGESVQQMMLVAGARQNRLEEEPAEDESAPEEDTADPMAEAFTVPIGDAAEQESEEAPEEDPLVAEGLPGAEELVDYVIAYTKARLSPVVARGLQVYRAQGASAMAQELKVTKAPKKTLAALARFATHHYRKVVLVYDRFDNWNWMPNDNKPAIIGALSELRWALGEHGAIVLLVAEGQAPELAEQFAGATRLEWDFPTLQAMEEHPPRLDVEVVRQWVDSASIDGAGRAIDDERIGRLIESSGGDVEKFLAAASAAVRDAARRGLDAVDDRAIEAASQTE